MATAPLLVINSNKQRKADLVFNTTEEIIAWLLHEKEYWSWFSASRANIVSPSCNQAVRTYYATVMNPFYDEAVTLAKRYASNAGDTQALELLKVRCNESYGDGRIALSGTPIAQHIISVKETDPSKAAMMLLIITNKMPPFTDGLFLPAMAAYLELWAYNHGLPGSAKAEKEALDQIHSALIVKLSEITRDSDVTKESISSVLKSIKESQAKAETDFAATSKRLSDEFDHVKNEHIKKAEETINICSDRINALESELKEKLILSSSENYWAGNRTKYIWLAVAMMLAAAAGGFFGFRYIMRSINEISQVVANSQPVQVWHYLKIVIPAIPILWAIRIAVRLFLSFVHIASDAQERVVMARTYLALVKQDKAIKSEDRQLILASLFRPSKTGLVKEDMIPPSLLTLVSNLSGGKTS